MWFKKKNDLKGLKLKRKSINRLAEMQKYFLVTRNVYLREETIVDWCIEAFHKQVIEKRVLEK